MLRVTSCLKDIDLGPHPPLVVHTAPYTSDVTPSWLHLPIKQIIRKPIVVILLTLYFVHASWPEIRPLDIDFVVPSQASSRTHKLRVEPQPG